MEAVILVIHLFLALAIIGLVLLQRSEGGGLGIGGGNSGGLGSFATGAATASFLTRATAICATAFFCTSLILGILAGSHSNAKQGILADVESPAAQELVVDEVVIPDAPDAAGEAGHVSEVPQAPIAE